MARFKVVVSDYDYPSLEIEQQVLKDIEHDFFAAHCQTPEEVIQIAHDADAILNQYAPITRKVIERLERCRVIARYGIGVDNIDVAAATEKGIMVANVPDYCLDEVSTHALALLFAVIRKITLLDKSTKNKKWDFTIARPLTRTRGKILGIVGLGKTGRLVAEKGRGLGWQIIAYDPYLTSPVLGVKMVSWEQLLSTADYISIHAPLTSETKHLFDEEAFRKMKSGAILVNTARGAIIDERALYKALMENHLGGAAIDVMEMEPPSPDNPLLRLENIIVTPHISYYSEDSYVELKTETAKAVVAVLSGKLPRSLVNPEVLRKFR